MTRRALRPEQCRALEAYRPRLLVVEHSNPRCRAPLVPCTCARVDAAHVEAPTREQIADAYVRRASRLARINGSLS